MDFIINNYVWFVVAGIVLLMAFIGYIAEKTNFGHKGKVKKETPVLKEVEVVAAPVVEVAPIILPVVTVEEPFSGPMVDEVTETPMVEEIPMVDATSMIDETPIVLPIEEPMVEGPMDTDEPIEEAVVTELPVVEETNEVGEEVTNEVPTEKISEISEVVGSEPANLDINQNGNDINIPLPELDAIKENADESTIEDQDVWKF